MDGGFHVLVDVLILQKSAFSSQGQGRLSHTDHVFCTASSSLGGNAGDKGAEQTRARNANHPNLQPPSSTHYAAPKTSANQSE
jgi:hypothetical protein